ncbi:hypothetical protein EIP86_003598 [Pleurotus ostreatoroseus]|nr:hypothetical protein EIP86_003598 [Pleurotus ostreatoroseus]
MRDGCRINRLPTEMLSEILVQWSRIDEDGPWMASMVCKHWRRVALQTQEAWAMPRLHYSPPKVSDEQWCIEEEDIEAVECPRDKTRPIDLWLERAGASQDITLVLTAFIACPQLAIRITSELRALQKHMPRIRVLLLTVETDAIAEHVLSMFKSMSPCMRLKHLEVTLTRSPRLPWNLRIAFAEQSTLRGLWDFAPRFETLTCKGCLPGFPIPLKSDSSYRFLRAIELDQVQLCPLRLANILTDCTELRSVRLSRIHNPYPHQVFQPVPQLHVLPRVHTFEVIRCTTLYVHKTMQTFTLPGLEQFTIENFGLDEIKNELAEGQKVYELMAEFGQAFADFMLRSPKLTTMHIRSSALPDRYLLSVLRNTPILRTLCLSRMFVGTPAMRGLLSHHRARTQANETNPVAEQAVPCPLLQHLHLDRCDLIDGDIFVSVVRSRKTSGGTTEPLASISVEDCPKITQRHITELQQSLGLRVHTANPEVAEA